ncbi:PIG-L family deacetylase [Sediminicoccus sp. KRV36]|uniref:PIG-L family deacetylase n=1 Tax=Sediminicoccus sp. KRV36 TaxID=3133721 RepID=UPI0020102740|nr:PIG-L family deacetylase [Sediminicoccus rosea]UPY35807.1 PIG-L family deacetylase [Sediminicoccus rosea]
MTPEPAELAATENLLILVTHPGEEVTRCEALIAEACRRARTPLLVVLSDGSGPHGDQALAEARAAATRSAARRLGVPEHRVFLLGLMQGRTPRPGTALHAKLVAALIFLMWSRDCGVIIVPRGDSPDHDCAWSAAEAVARETGVGLLAA